MPAIVLIGAQWGDEGKGKATDLLGSPRRLRRQVQRRQQRRPHGRHRRREVRAAPAALRHPHPRRRPGHRQRRRRRPRGAVRRARRARARAASTPRGCVVSANAHVITPYNRTIDKVTERFLGKRQIGTTGRGIGPTYADKMNRVGIRVQDLFDEKILRQKVEGALEQKNHLLVKVYNRRADHRRRGRRASCSRYAERLRPMVADTALLLGRGARRRQDRAARGRPGHAARRRPRHLPVRHLVQRDRRRRVHRLAASPPTRIDRVIALVKAYTTRVGEGPFPTELLDDDGERLRADRRRVRHHHRPPAPLRLVRRPDRPLRRARQRRHRLRAHQARRAHRLGAASRSASPTTSTASASTRCR